MTPALASTLLVAALLLAFVRYAQTAEPVVSVCPRCGDLVQHLPHWPTPCPHCDAILL
jgi:hypothetical protein